MGIPDALPPPSSDPRLLRRRLVLARAGSRARPGPGGLRLPAVGVLEKYPADAGLVLFVLFMLSSTAFDGFHSTIQWLKGYWEVLSPQIRWVDTAWLSPCFFVNS